MVSVKWQEKDYFLLNQNASNSSIVTHKMYIPKVTVKFIIGSIIIKIYVGQ